MNTVLQENLMRVWEELQSLVELRTIANEEEYENLLKFGDSLMYVINGNEDHVLFSLAGIVGTLLLDWEKYVEGLQS